MKTFIVFLEKEKSESVKRFTVQAFGLVEALEQTLGEFGDGLKSIMCIEVPK